MSTLYVHRLVVESWPTPDGKPWARYYGPDCAVPNHTIPVWLAPLLEKAMPHMYRYNDGTPILRVAERIRYDDDRDELRGVLMPLPQRKFYLSAPGIQRVAQDMRAFGAVVHIERSKAVEWVTA